MKGLVSDFKRMAVHDGPGMRTTVFLKGCPLRCLWCHNPENLSAAVEISYTPKICVSCGACADVCPKQAHIFDENGHRMDHSLCVRCGACVEACMPGALKRYGMEMTAEETAQKLLEDRLFFITSGGGVTVSGGEPLLQSEFVAEVFSILKKHGVHTAVDTCGCVPWQAFENVLGKTDLFLYDLKHMDSAAHKRGTGRDNELICENLIRLGASGAKIEIRMPIIPGYNADDENLMATARFVSKIPGVQALRLLPYHSLARDKYTAIGLEDTMPDAQMPSTEKMRAWQKMLADIFPATCLSSDLAP